MIPRPMWLRTSGASVRRNGRLAARAMSRMPQIRGLTQTGIRNAPRRTCHDASRSRPLQSIWQLQGVELCRRAFVQKVGICSGRSERSRTPSSSCGRSAITNCTLCLPATPGRAAHPLDIPPLHLWRTVCSRARWEHSSRSPAHPSVSPDLTFVPLAAFDRRGYRIGYGGGYYDATLAQAAPDQPRTGHRHCLFVPGNRSEYRKKPHDQPLDLILTEDELIDCSLAWRQTGQA